MLYLSFIKSSSLGLYFICSRRSWGTLIWVIKPWQPPEKQVFPLIRTRLLEPKCTKWEANSLLWQWGKAVPAKGHSCAGAQHLPELSEISSMTQMCSCGWTTVIFNLEDLLPGESLGCRHVAVFEVWSSLFLLSGEAILPVESRWFLVLWCVCAWGRK